MSDLMSKFPNIPWSGGEYGVFTTPTFSVFQGLIYNRGIGSINAPLLTAPFVVFNGLVEDEDTQTLLQQADDWFARQPVTDDEVRLDRLKLLADALSNDDRQKLLWHLLELEAKERVDVREADGLNHYAIRNGRVNLTEFLTAYFVDYRVLVRAGNAEVLEELLYCIVAALVEQKRREENGN